jgi:hypothetical protein
LPGPNPPAPAGAGGFPGAGGFGPGNLLVSESFYQGNPGIVAGQTQLPPGCTTGCVTATANGSYPQVFNNDLVDGSFGVTSRIFLSEMTPAGRPLGTVEVPNGLVTSFSSKSELALNLSPDGRTVSFMGYVAKPAQLDVSNSNTPGVIDPTSPVPGSFYRAAAQLSGSGRIRLTETNAYSGNNGRAAITAEAGGKQLIYTAGNAATGLSWTPATDGLRNITGRVNRDGTATIWAVTSTVSGSGDQGADPNKLVEITDPLAAASPAAGESFRMVRAARFAEVLRGVSFTPGR